MRIGYMPDVHGGPYDQPVPTPRDAAEKMDAMIEEGLLAERSGFHSLHVPHRHGRTETYFPGPLQLLTILARETERVALGTFTLVSTLMHPLLVAEQAAVIDNLSRGRFFLSLGRGYHDTYWRHFGIPQERLLARHKEAVAIIQRALAGGRFTYDGDFWSVDDSLLTPQAHQEGGFPIWGAGDSLPAMVRAASYGEAWCCSPFPLQQEMWDETVGAYREMARSLGKEPFVVLMRDGFVADDFETAARTFGPHYVEDMTYYHRQGILDHHPDFESAANLTVEQMRAHAVMGSPQDCIEQLERYERDFGIDYVVMRMREPTGPSFEATRESIQRFGEEVCAYFNRRDPTPDHPAIPQGARW